MLKGQNVIEISKNVFWIGAYLDKRLEVNVYLKVFEGEEKKINLVIDPGPPSVFDTIRENISGKIGNLKNVHFTFLNHQDPDVVTNIMYLHKFNPNLKVICTEDTWRLVNFLGLKATNLQAIDKFSSNKGKLSTGHSIQFIPTPFCHFRGASMLYDLESRVLFTGDLFGGITHSDGLFATSENWHGLRAFHQLYMPSQEALRSALDSIRNLKPKPEIIAPQHGALIKGELIDDFISRLYELPVGWNLLDSFNKSKDFYIEAVNDIIDAITKRIGKEVVEQAINEIESDGSFPNLFEFKNEKIFEIKMDPIKSFRMLLDSMQKDQPRQNLEIIRNAVLKAAVDWNLPLFESLIGDESTKSELLEIVE